MQTLQCNSELVTAVHYLHHYDIYTCISYYMMYMYKLFALPWCTRVSYLHKYGVHV